MYLNMQDIIADLQRERSVQAYNIPEQWVVTDIQLLPLDREKDLDPSTAYVCEYRQVKNFGPVQEDVPLICAVPEYVDTDPIFYSRRRIVLVRNASQTEVLASLTRVMYSRGMLASPALDVSQKLMQCRTLEQLIRTGYQYLGNPIIVADGKQKILAYTDPVLVDSEIYDQILRETYLPVGHPTIAGAKLEFSLNGAAFRNNGNQTVPNVICKELIVAGSTKGFLHVIQLNRPFKEEDSYLVTLLGNLAAIAVWNTPGFNRMNQEERIEQFFRDILDGHLEGQGNIEARRKMLDLKLKKNICTIVLQTRMEEMSLGTSIFDQSREIASLLPGCRSFLYKNSIHMLMDSDGDLVPGNSVLDALRPYLEQNRLVAGVSNPFHDLYNLREYSHQAVEAIRIGYRIHPQERMYEFRYYALYFLLESGIQHVGSVNICAPELERLMNDNRSGHAELVETLKVYLECGCSKTATAEKMYTHLNTVKYRIAQIQHILGIDISEGDNALRLMLSYRMLECKEKLMNH